MTASATITKALEGAGYRLTRPRRTLAELIAARRSHFTADDLVREARERRLGVARATIFRTLDVLTALGLVERLDMPTGEHAFVACEPSHHHHIVCSSCGRASDVPDRQLRAALDSIASETGFRVDRHRVELFGLCPACRLEARA
jgi:Fur family ferric uptake transcriptional regulator